MNRTIQMLSILLIVQLVLVFGLLWQQSAKSTGESNARLLNLSKAEIDAVTLKGEKSSLTLKKQNGTWVLPDLFGFPASKQRVNEFLDQLLKIQIGWPVGTTDDAANRFKVTDSNFERKITFHGKGKELATLYLGTSPSFKKVHARTNQQKKTYAIHFSSYQAEPRANHWMDDSYLHVDPKNIASVEMPDFSLSRTKDEFTLSNLGEQEQINNEAVRALLEKLSHLSFREVIGKGQLPSDKRGDEKFRYRLTLKSGEKVDYIFSQPKGQTDYVLAPSSTDYVFKLTGYSVDAIRKTERAALVSPVKNTSAKSNGATAPSK